MEELPDTLTPSTEVCVDSQELPPVWGHLTNRRVFLSSLELRKNCYKFGRDPNCDICLSLKNLPNPILKLTSKEHFLISQDRTNVPFIKDLSKNGTYLNGKNLGRKSASLCDGDLIAIGSKLHEIYQFKDESRNFISKDFDSKYAITRSIGKGAFGEVFLAISKKTSQRYAVKKLSNSGKFLNEIQIMEKLIHPCVCRMFEAIFTSQHVYILMEYMEGGELQSRVLQKKSLKESVAKLYLYQTVTAVKYLHESGIVHRDLKPENLLLLSLEIHTILKVSDFGMSKIVGQTSQMRTLCGTPLYVAPEILKLKATTPSAASPSASYTPQVDVWSVGCILYFMLFGRTPFQSSDDPPDLYLKIIAGHYEIPEQEAPLFEVACKLIEKMLETDPLKRINIDEIVEDEWFQDQGMRTKLRELFD